MAKQTTKTDNGTSGASTSAKKPPNGFKQLTTAPVLDARESVALGILQSLLPAEAPKNRLTKKQQLISEAFELADAFLAVARDNDQ